MSPFARPSLRLAVALSLPLGVLAACARPLASGYTFGFSRVGTTQGARARSDTVVGQGQWDAAGNGRMDIIKGPRPHVAADQWMSFMSPGSYTIVRASDHTMAIVDSAKKQYFEIDVDAMGQAAGGAMAAAGGMIQMTVSDLTTTSRRLEPAVVSGIHADHYSVAQSYELTVSTMGNKKTSHVESAKEFWIDASLPMFKNPFDVLRNEMLNRMGLSGMMQVESALEAEQAKYPRGLQVRFASRETRTPSAGAATTMTSSFELTSSKKASIPASVFQVPAGYTKVNLGMPAAAGTSPQGGTGNAPAITSAQQAQLNTAMKVRRSFMKNISLDSSAMDTAKNKIFARPKKP